MWEAALLTLTLGGGDFSIGPKNPKPLSTWKGHKGTVTALTVLPDGTVVSGSEDKTLRRWDATSGRCLSIWKGHTDYVKALTVLPDGAVVSGGGNMFGGGDKALRRWDSGTGQCIGRWKGHTWSVEALTVLPDGTVVSGSFDETLGRWDPTSGECLRTWKGHTDIVWVLTVLPDGTVVSGSEDKTLRRWDPTSGECLRTWEGHTDYVKALTVLPDGTVVSGSDDKTLRRWDPTSGECMSTWKGHTDYVKALTVLSDGTVVSGGGNALGGGDNTLRRWDPTSGQCIGRWKGHTRTVTALTVLPDGSVVSGSDDKTIRRWPSVGCVLTDKQQVAVLEALKANTSVISLSIAQSTFSVSEFEELLAVLKTHPVLQSVALEHCGLDAKRIEQVLDALAQGFNQPQLLPKTLSLVGNPGLDNPEVQYTLEQCYLSGDVLLTDKPEKLHRIFEAAEKGHAMAQWCLGLLYITGIGVASHSDKAQEWLAQARAQALPPLAQLLALGREHSVFRIQQNLTVYHLMALMGDERWYTTLQALSHDERQKWGLLDEDTVLTKNQQGLRASALARQQYGFIAEDKGIKTLSAEALNDSLLHRYHRCATVLRQGEEEAQLAKVLQAQQQQQQIRLNYTQRFKALSDNIGELYSDDAGRESARTLSGDYHGLLQRLWSAKQVLCYLETAMKNVGVTQWPAAHGYHSLLPQVGKPKARGKAPGIYLYRAGTPLQVYALVINSESHQETMCLSEEGTTRNQFSPLSAYGQYLLPTPLTAEETMDVKGKAPGFYFYRKEAQGKQVAQVFVLIVDNPFSHSTLCLSEVLTHLDVLDALPWPPHTKALDIIGIEDKGSSCMSPISFKAPLPKALLDVMIAHHDHCILDWVGHQAVDGITTDAITVKLPARFVASILGPKACTHTQWLKAWSGDTILSPPQTIIRLRDAIDGPQTSKRFLLRLKTQGRVAYIHYYIETLQAVIQTYDKRFAAHPFYKRGKQAWMDILRAYEAYEQLWRKAGNNDAQKAYLLTTPTLMLQANQRAVPLKERVDEGDGNDNIFSPAKTLSYFLNSSADSKDPEQKKIRQKLRMVGAGTAPVFPINGVHYKRYPHAPGVEFMVSSLGNVLAGEGATPTVLLKVIGPDGIPYPYQASHTVQGKDLQSIIQHHPECIKKIRHDNFSAVTVLGMLTDPQDGKPDNYMVEFEVDKDTGTITEIEILGIDNDIAFADVVISKHVEREKAGHYFINIKNVIYFFPQMHQPIDPTFRDTFLKREPEFILMEWLSGLHEKNTEYATLLKEGVFTEEEYKGDDVISKRGLQLPIKVVPGTIRTLYRKLCQINATLKDNPSITLWELLVTVEPEVAIHYAKVRAQHPHETYGCDMMACITALYEENISNGRELMYFRAQLDNGFTHTMTSVVLKTAEEFGFEDNRTATLDNCLWKLLRILHYERFTGKVSGVLYMTLTALVNRFYGDGLLNLALSHEAYGCVYWLWREKVVRRENIMLVCEQVKKVSLLHFFVEGKQDAAVKDLLKGNVYPINVTNHQGYTPLHIAASIGDAAMVECLLTGGADVEAVTRLGKTPLMMAQSRMKQSSNPGKYKGVIVLLQGVNQGDKVEPVVWKNRGSSVAAGLGLVAHKKASPQIGNRSRWNRGGGIKLRGRDSQRSGSFSGVMGKRPGSGQG